MEEKEEELFILKFGGIIWRHLLIIDLLFWHFLGKFPVFNGNFRKTEYHFIRKLISLSLYTNLSNLQSFN